MSPDTPGPTGSSAARASGAPGASGSDWVDLCVVGSGFGGAITALRAVRRGWSVRILERGRLFPPGTFPRQIRDVNDVFWRQARHPARRGLYDIHAMRGVGIVAAAGVGGGSLIYANILIRPDAWVFDDARWPDAYRRDSLDVCFARVEAMLAPSPLPESVASTKREMFRFAADRLQRPVFDPPQAVRWSGPSEPGRTNCRYCAECEFGCNLGAKNTLDLTYLRDARAEGAVLRPQARVDYVAPRAGGYTVHGTAMDSRTPFTVHARRVVLAAGTLGTNTILLRSRDDARSLPKLSRRLGTGFSANGDLLATVTGATTDLAPWHGTDVTSVMRFTDHGPRFTMAAPTFNQAAMEVLSRAVLPPLPERLAGLLQPLWPRVPGLLDFAARMRLLDRRSWLSRLEAGRAARTTNLFCIGQDNANGRLHLKDGRLDCEWNYAQENAALIAAQQQAIRDVADLYGARQAPVFSWGLFRKILSVHPLGGARLAERPEDGVVDTRGEVFGYPGLYVADGAVIPTAIGFHPSHTIAAVAERIAEQMQ